ncbi:MAG: patatin family protein, partial [Hafnia sp.]
YFLATVGHWLLPREDQPNVDKRAFSRRLLQPSDTISPEMPIVAATHSAAKNGIVLPEPQTNMVAEKSLILPDSVHLDKSARQTTIDPSTAKKADKPSSQDSST